MMRVHNGVVALALVLSLAGCRGEKKRDYEAEHTRLREYVVAELPKDARKLQTEFEGKARLVGYQLRPATAARPGQKVTLTLYWQVEKPLDAGSRLFTHVLDASGERILALDDVGPLREPKQGEPALPPEAWKPGKVYADKISFRLPKSVKTEKIEIVAGFTRKGERLKVVSGPKDGPGAARVATLTVNRRKERTPPVGSVRLVKLEPGAKIKIDGKLDEPAWAEARELSLRDADGRRNPKITVGGKVKALWSDEGLYVGFDVIDGSLTGGFDPKDQKEPELWRESAVGVVIDPDGDQKNYYEIMVNAQGLVFDTRFDDFKQPWEPKKGIYGNAEWSSGAKAAVTLRGTLDKDDDKDEGYVAEVLIPWSAFETKKAPNIGDTYRINFFVFDDHQRKNAAMWSPRLQESAHRVSRFGRVSFVDKATLAKEEKDKRRITPEELKKLQVMSAKAAKPPAVVASSLRAATPPPPAAAPEANQ
nr:MAG: hypothetical protein DIU78_01665 [Pseudomonadota bacterium]